MPPFDPDFYTSITREKRSLFGQYKYIDAAQMYQDSRNRTNAKTKSYLSSGRRGLVIQYRQEVAHNEGGSAVVLDGNQSRKQETCILSVSRFTVNEKQHRISGSLELGSGFLSEQLVRMAFWLLSKAIAPNFSQ